MGGVRLRGTNTLLATVATVALLVVAETGAARAKGWIGAHAKAVGGLGLTADRRGVARSANLSAGAGWLVPVTDAFTGVTAHARSPLALFARAHAIWVTKLTLWNNAGTGRETYLGLGPGLRLALFRGMLLIEAGVVGVFEHEEETEVSETTGTLEKRNKLRVRPLPNVGIVLRLASFGKG